MGTTVFGFCVTCNVLVTTFNATYFQFEIPSYVNDEAANLISQILVKDPSLRPSLSDILSHPWIVNNAEASIKLKG